MDKTIKYGEFVLFVRHLADQLPEDIIKYIISKALVKVCLIPWYNEIYTVVSYEQYIEESVTCEGRIGYRGISNNCVTQTYYYLNPKDFKKIEIGVKNIDINFIFYKEFNIFRNHNLPNGKGPITIISDLDTTEGIRNTNDKITCNLKLCNGLGILITKFTAIEPQLRYFACGVKDELFRKIRKKGIFVDDLYKCGHIEHYCPEWRYIKKSHINKYNTPDLEVNFEHICCKCEDDPTTPNF